MNKKSGVIFNKDTKKEKAKATIKNAIYVVACLAIMFATVAAFLYALLTPDY